MVLEDPLHLGVQEAVGEGHGEALGGEEEGAEVCEYWVEDRGGGERGDDGDEVGDAKEGDDHQQRLGGPPVLVVRGLPLPACGPQLGHNYIEDGDQEECVSGQDQEDGADVDPLMVGGLHEGTVM